MRLEEEYADVLQNIEYAIVTCYHHEPALCDGDVMRALEALIEEYKAELVGREPRPANLSDDERNLVAAMKDMCE